MVMIKPNHSVQYFATQKDFNYSVQTIQSVPHEWAHLVLPYRLFKFPKQANKFNDSLIRYEETTKDNKANE